MNAMNEEKIHVSISSDNNYVEYAYLVLLSLLKNTNNSHNVVVVHFLSMGLSVDSKAKLQELATTYNTELRFYDIDEALFEGFVLNKYFTAAAYSRLLLPTLLKDIDKVLYLDCDLLVRSDISNLYNTDISNYSVAGVYDRVAIIVSNSYHDFDLQKEGYINSGVILINLDYWRRNDIGKKIMKWIVEMNPVFLDQDGINAILHGTILFLDLTWNFQEPFFQYNPQVPPEHHNYVKKIYNNPAIVHFCGPIKPWKIECYNQFRHEWVEYKKQTPWSETEYSFNTKTKSHAYIVRYKGMIKRFLIRKIWFIQTMINK